MKNTINSFVETMLAEQENFEDIQNEIKRCEDSVQAVIDNFNVKEKHLIETAQQNLQSSGKKEFSQIFEISAQSLNVTLEGVTDRIKEAIKGMTFIQGFEKKFTIAVFGKVKAGKSYIGNFVMGNSIKQTGADTIYNRIEKPIVNVYDCGKLSQQDNLSEQDDFKTGPNETTSTIQWFELGALSWFDTPGIGSVTWENELLAKEYVKNADLVVFACNSDAAGTRQEFAEMKQLYDMDKPILLLLTQSDTYEDDVDDNGDEISVLVPKSDKDRLDTENYMIDTLSEQGMSDILRYSILTVSAKLALEALKNNDEVKFEQSNMGKFLETLVSITKNDAAEMKKLTPKNRINEMIDSIITDLQKMSEEIVKVCSSIAEDKAMLEDREDDLLELIRSKVNSKVLSVIHNCKMKIEKNKETISEEALAEKINTAIQEGINEVCAEESLKGVEKIEQLNIHLGEIGDMRMRQDQIAYQHTIVGERERAAKSLGEKFVKAITFGKKKYYESYSKTETRYVSVDLGVNDADIEQNIAFKLDDVFRTTVTEFISAVVSGYYEPIEKIQTATVDEILKAIKQLGELKM